MIDAALMGGVFAICMALIKIIEKFLEKRNGSYIKSGLTQAEHDWLRSLHQMHNQFDEDGAPGS